MKYTIVLDLEEGVNKSTGEERSVEQIIKYLQLTVQQAVTRAEVLIHKVEVKQGKSSGATRISAGRDGSTPGRKPINRPKIEQWIRDNITAGPSTQGTVGLEGVDKEGKPLHDAPNRIYIHRLAAPVEMGGCGVSMLGIQTVLGELEREGYLERGFAAGAPFYELIRPLEEEGKVGIRGRALDEELPTLGPLGEMPASVREVDFEDIEED